MSEPLQHDYIGLSESSSMERSSESSNFSTESEKTMLLTSKPPSSDLACLVSPKILKNTTAKLCLLRTFFQVVSEGFLMLMSMFVKIGGLMTDVTLIQTMFHLLLLCSPPKT
ncbi:hypothetical protein LXL04_010007 [Taraxacum kok-saghyz]